MSVSWPCSEETSTKLPRSTLRDPLYWGLGNRATFHRVPRRFKWLKIRKIKPRDRRTSRHGAPRHGSERFTARLLLKGSCSHSGPKAPSFSLSYATLYSLSGHILLAPYNGRSTRNQNTSTRAERATRRCQVSNKDSFIHNKVWRTLGEEASGRVVPTMLMETGDWGAKAGGGRRFFFCSMRFS